MSNIRFVANLELEVVLPDGKKEKRPFDFGSIYSVEKLEADAGDKEYVDIFFKDKSVVKGLSRRVLELMNSRIKIREPAAPPAQPAKPAETPKDNK